MYVIEETTVLTEAVNLYWLSPHNIICICHAYNGFISCLNFYLNNYDRELKFCFENLRSGDNGSSGHPSPPRALQSSILSGASALQGGDSPVPLADRAEELGHSPEPYASCQICSLT